MKSLFTLGIAITFHITLTSGPWSLLLLLGLVVLELLSRRVRKELGFGYPSLNRADLETYRMGVNNKSPNVSPRPNAEGQGETGKVEVCYQPLTPTHTEVQHAPHLASPLKQGLPPRTGTQFIGESDTTRTTVVVPSGGGSSHSLVDGIDPVVLGLDKAFQSRLTTLKEWLNPREIELINALNKHYMFKLISRSDNGKFSDLSGKMYKAIRLSMLSAYRRRSFNILDQAPVWVKPFQDRELSTLYLPSRLRVLGSSHGRNTIRLEFLLSAWDI
jgi:hypothetical protein